MADDRSVEDPTQMVARLATDLDDFKSTVLARLSRRATGDVEIAIRDTPKPGTLFLQGQIVLRADYPNLWAWVQENNLLRTGLFVPANGTTQFGLPNWQGRIPIGVGSLSGEDYVLGQLDGAARRVMTEGQMPRHGGHFNGNRTNVGYAADPDADNYIQPIDLDDLRGNNEAFDVRQPSVAINWAIWV